MPFERAKLQTTLVNQERSITTIIVFQTHS